MKGTVMDTSTLVTKVLLPRRRRDVLTRQRLLDRLYDMVERKCVLIPAPAGYGKTTLLLDWAYDLEHPVCWYALDQSDHDPRVFLEHLILSLHHRFPDFGERTRQALAATPNLADGAPNVVNVLISEMVDVIPRWFVLVLDDYHRLEEAPEVGAILARCLAHQTDQFLIIIASRTVPALPFIIQLTARGEIDGMGQRDLRFRTCEIQGLLTQNYGLHVSEKEAEEMAIRSDGWITGILLTAHTMWHDILEGWMQASASDQPIYEYLTQEVFARQEPPVQAFLTASSTLQEMNPALCQEALGLEETEHFLTLLEERNLFIVQLEGEWYRYHHLFQEYLQTRLRWEDESRWTELHRSAARWFKARGRPEEAVYHYLAVSAYEDAAPVMDAAAQDMYDTGRLETLMAWSAALPILLRERVPRLMLFQARAAYMLGQWEESLALTEIAERSYRANEDYQNLAHVLLHRCLIWLFQGQAREAFALACEVLSLVKETGVPVAYETHRIIGISSLMRGQLEDGETHLRQALRHSQEQGSPYDRSSIQLSLADCLWRQGRWKESVTIMQQAVATQRQLGNLVALAAMLNDLGFSLHLIGEYGEALRTLEEALKLARQSGYRRCEAFALNSLGELICNLGMFERAVEIFGQVLSIANEMGDGVLFVSTLEALGLARCRQGDYTQAQADIKQAIEQVEQQHLEYQLGRYRASLGLVRVEAGDVEAGLADLDCACERLERIGAHSELARAQFFTAWALFRANREAEALATLQQVFATTNSPSREHLLAVEGQRALPLLEHAHAQGVGGEELATLLARARTFEQTAQTILQQASPLKARAETKEPLRVFGFGPGRVEREEKEIPISEWGAAATRRLFFYLLTHPSRSRDQIAAVLWPELPASKVKANFHPTKYRLKRALGQEPLHFDGSHYQIHPHLDYWFDVEEFERLLKGSGSGRRIEQLQQAIALYQGDFLEDYYDDWCLLLRTRLREQYLEALDELTGRLLARRQYRQAIQTLRQGLKVDDLQEKFHRQLMCTYALSGQRSQALAQYQRCAEILERELGVSPSLETTILYQRILDGLPLD
jgi:LuxR family maltose regulon positive regulatory protein